MESDWHLGVELDNRDWESLKVNIIILFYKES